MKHVYNIPECCAYKKPKRTFNNTCSHYLRIWGRTHRNMETVWNVSVCVCLRGRAWCPPVLHWGREVWWQQAGPLVPPVDWVSRLLRGPGPCGASLALEPCEVAFLNNQPNRSNYNSFLILHWKCTKEQNEQAECTDGGGISKSKDWSLMLCLPAIIHLTKTRCISS